MYALHHLYPPDREPRQVQHHGPARRSLRHRVASMAVHLGGSAVALGWRLVDAGQQARNGDAGGWLARSAHPPNG